MHVDIGFVQTESDLQVGNAVIKFRTDVSFSLIQLVYTFYHHITGVFSELYDDFHNWNSNPF